MLIVIMYWVISTVSSHYIDRCRLFHEMLYHLKSLISRCMKSTIDNPRDTTCITNQTYRRLCHVNDPIALTIVVIMVGVIRWNYGPILWRQYAATRFTCCWNGERGRWRTKAICVHEIIRRRVKAFGLGTVFYNSVAQWKTWPSNWAISAEVHQDRTLLCHKAARVTILDVAAHCMMTSFPADFQGVEPTGRIILDRHRYNVDEQHLWCGFIFNDNNMPRANTCWEWRRFFLMWFISCIYRIILTHPPCNDPIAVTALIIVLINWTKHIILSENVGYIAYANCNNVLSYINGFITLYR